MKKMRIFELRDSALNSDGGEYVLGFQDTGSHACYMIYGVLNPAEKRRLVKPGKGHEEILLAVKGDLEVSGYYAMTLKEGFAFHIKGDHECFLENKGNFDAVYVIAGGHSAQGHH